MKKISLLLLMALLQLACNNTTGNVDGGPCAYKEDTHPAKLIRLETTDSLTYNGLFEIEAGLQSTDKKDTVSFNRLNNSYIEKAQIEKDSIAEGKVYKYIIQTITSGSCDPNIRIIRLEKY